MKHIIKHFKTVDPTLAAAIKAIDLIVPSNDYFSDLCEIIVQQQLSEKAGATIYARFEALFPRKKVTAKKLLALRDAKIRSVGTSGSKITYLKNLARHAQDFDLRTLRDMKNEEVIAELTKIKGIGPWSAEMFLMFSLGREDVFSYGDLGLRRAIQKLYKFKKEPTVKQMEKIVRKWSPYRTYGARILWKMLE